MAEARAAVLLITRNLPPLLGGMERLNQRMAGALTQKYRLAAIGPWGSTSHLPQSCELSAEAPHRSLLRFMLHAWLQALRLAWRLRPSIVIAGSGLTSPIAWLAARFSRSRSVVYLHGLDVVAPSRVYQTLWLPFIRRMDLVLVNSRHTGRLATERGIASERIAVLNPGTDLPANCSEHARAFRQKHSFGDRPLLLSVGRLTPRKGLPEFVEYSFPELLAEYPDILLLVIGDDANDAVKTIVGSERARISAAAIRAGTADAIKFLPQCDDETLSAAYWASDLHVFPIRELRGDVEGFGMVAIESAAHGLQTIAFRAGGVEDAIVEGVTGKIVSPGNYGAFAAAALGLLAKRHDQDLREDCRAEAARYGWDRFAAKLIDLLAGAEAMQTRGGQKE